MTDNVVPFNGITTLPIEPCKVLDNAPRTLQSVTVIGFNEDGSLYFASSDSDIGEIILAIELAKRVMVDELIG